MVYVYPAIFSKNSDESYTITFPDLPGCISEGKNLGNALSMAESALKQWLEYLQDKHQAFPKETDVQKIKVDTNQFVNLVYATIKDNKAVRRTVSIPRWMDDEVNKKGFSLSKVLQDALVAKL